MYSPPLTRSKARQLKRKTISATTAMNDDKKDVKCEEITVLTTGTKKIKLSQDEKHLSGAPEGDIYDISVASDENLCALTNPSLEWESSLNILSLESSSWAEKHTAVETIRKISIHHSELLNEERVSVALMEATKATGSLRSCICRNGILCLQSLYRLPFLSNWLHGSCVDIFGESLTTLMNKSVNSPKFICASALVALEIGVDATPFAMLPSSLLPLSQHKNAEIINRSFLFVAEQSRKQKDSLHQESDEVLCAMLLLLERGLSSPRPTGRDASKKALDVVTKSLGLTRLQTIVDSLIPEDKKKDFARFVDKLREIALVSSCLSPKTSRPSATKPKRSQVKAPKPIARPSFKDHIKLMKSKQLKKPQQEEMKPGDNIQHSSSGNSSASSSLDSIQLII